jgi:hypothetical protein
MERLTKRLEDGQAVMDCAACGVSWHKKRKKDIPYCTALFCRNRLKERLAAYEDTGLDPQDIISAADMAKIACALHELNAYKDLGTIDHLRELSDADHDGRLVLLPCKVGDHVWVNGREAIVVWFFGYKTERYLHTQFLDNAQYIDIPFSEIGKTVFLTREEAEAELKGEHDG